MCLVSPDEATQGGWATQAKLAEYPAGCAEVCLCVTAGDHITLKIPCTKEDADYLDNFDGPVHLWSDDPRPYRIVGTKDRKLRHRAAAMLAILRGYIGSNQPTKPPCLSSQSPAMSPADPLAAQQSLDATTMKQLEEKTSDLKRKLTETEAQVSELGRKCSNKESKINLMRKVCTAVYVSVALLWLSCENRKHPSDRLRSRQVISSRIGINPLDATMSSRALTRSKQSGARKRRKQRPWKSLSTKYRKNVRHEMILPLMRRMKHIVGGAEGMDMEFAHCIQTYAESSKKQGVKLERCLFANPIAIFEKSDIVSKYRDKVITDVKHAITANELMVTLSEIGVGPHAMRKLRKRWKEKKYDIFHGERIILREKKDELQEAHDLLGKPTKIALTLKTVAKHPKFAHKFHGYKYDTKKIILTAARRALTAAAQPEDNEDIDFDEAEEDSRQKISNDLALIRSNPGASESYKVKKEAQLNNLTTKMESARRCCKLKGANFTPAKEKTVGTSMHRQFMSGVREIGSWVNAAFDGRPILRQLTKSQESDQFCSSFTFINDGTPVQSVETQYATAVSPGGESNCWPVLGEILRELAELRDEGAEVHMLIHAHHTRADEQFNVSETRLAFRVSITVDGAMMFKFCAGKCGGSARLRCPCCPMIHDRHKKDNKGRVVGEYTDHFAFLIVEAIQGETKRQFARRNGIRLEVIDWCNDSKNHDALKGYTSRGGQESDPDTRKPWAGLSKLKADDPMTWSRGKRLLRGRF